VKIDTINIDLTKIVLLAFAVIILLQTQCGEKGQPEVIIDTRVETTLDTITIEKVKYVPTRETVVKTIYDTIPQKVDTVEILKDYFSKVVYRDTIDIDTFGNIVIEDTVSRNQIVSRELFSNIILPTTIITTETIKNKRSLYAGVNLSGNREVFNQLDVGLMLKGKNDKLYGIGLGLDRNLQPILTGSLYWKVQIKKPKLNIKLY